MEEQQEKTIYENDQGIWQAANLPSSHLLLHGATRMERLSMSNPTKSEIYMPPGLSGFDRLMANFLI
jgi:hypothetical protein